METEYLLGNLKSYRNYLLPTARDLFGSTYFRTSPQTKHRQNVQEMLELLGLNGPMSTWDLAKSAVPYNNNSIRTLDKEYRRLLLGRIDRGKKNPGVSDIGLVVNDRTGQNNTNKYRLSICGILYIVSLANFNDNDIIKLTQNYAKHIPMIFGKWEYVVSIFPNSFNLFKGLSSGIVFDNTYVNNISTLPFFEINNYVHTKYNMYYERIQETDLVEQISYWFYTNLPLHLIVTGTSKEIAITKWMELFGNDTELRKWYYSFIDEMYEFHNNRFIELYSVLKIKKQSLNFS